MIRLLVRLAATALVAVAVLAAMPVYGRMTADGRLTPALRRQLAHGGPRRSPRDGRARGVFFRGPAQQCFSYPRKSTKSPF